MRQVELNLVHANLVKASGAYRWSSYRTNTLSQADRLDNPLGEYLALGTARGSVNQHVVKMNVLNRSIRSQKL